jgi:hypothetical protein
MKWARIKMENLMNPNNIIINNLEANKFNINNYNIYNNNINNNNSNHKQDFTINIITKVDNSYTNKINKIITIIINNI